MEDNNISLQNKDNKHPTNIYLENSLFSNETNILNQKRSKINKYKETSLNNKLQLNNMLTNIKKGISQISEDLTSSENNIESYIRKHKELNNFRNNNRNFPYSYSNKQLFPSFYQKVNNQYVNISYFKNLSPLNKNNIISENEKKKNENDEKEIKNESDKEEKLQNVINDKMNKEQIKEKDFEINNLQQKNKLVIEENEILKEQIKNY